MAEVVEVIANSATTTLPNLVPLALQSVLHSYVAYPPRMGMSYGS